jgi:tetratricopeptide (TPR) repeat protein
MAADFIDLNEGTDPEGPGPTPASSASPTLPDPSDGTAERTQPQRGTVAVDVPRGQQTDTTATRSLGQVFQEFREEVGRAAGEDTAADQYRLALTYHDMGMIDDAITALESAARAPRQRFDAASMLGRLHLERQELAKAISWFERAAEAPAPTTDAGRALLYDLAATLEAAGEGSRALAAFVELEAESGGYRDVARRIEYLSRAQSRG